MGVLSSVLQSNLAMSPIRHLSVWVVEFIKLLVGRRPHPLLTQCPICQQTVHLHVNRAGRRHVFAHARGLYEGCRLCKHYAGKIKCLGSGALMIFDPHPTNINVSSCPIPCLKTKLPILVFPNGSLIEIAIALTCKNYQENLLCRFFIQNPKQNLRHPP